MNTGRTQVGGRRTGVQRVMPELVRTGHIFLRGARSVRRVLQDERGAVTAEYAIIIMATNTCLTGIKSVLVHEVKMGQRDSNRVFLLISDGAGNVDEGHPSSSQKGLYGTCMSANLNRRHRLSDGFEILVQ